VILSLGGEWDPWSVLDGGREGVRWPCEGAGGIDGAPIRPRPRGLTAILLGAGGRPLLERITSGRPGGGWAA